MPNAFDELFKIQNEKRNTAQVYYFWLKIAGKNTKIVTVNERLTIYRWIMEDPEISDKSCKIRAIILRSIPLDKLPDLLDINSLEQMHPRIRVIVKKRLRR